MAAKPPKKRRRIGLIIGLSVGIPVGVILLLVLGGGLLSYLMVGAAEEEMYGDMMEAEQQINASMGVITLQSAVEIYRIQNPNTCPTYTDLVMTGAVTPDTSSIDPWGNPYVIDCSTGVPAVYSVGPDGSAGTFDDIRG